MRSFHVLAATIGFAWFAAPAAADYTTVAPVRPLTMSDPSGLSSIALELQLTRWTEPRVPPIEVDVQSLTFDLAADIRIAPHWVLIARLPIVQASLDGDPLAEDCCGFGLGNLTLGGRGLWATVFDGGARAVAGAELSLSAPTASDEGEGIVSAGAAAFARLPHDPGRYAPNTTTIRFTPLVQYYTPRFLIGAEAGLQLFLYDGDVDDQDSDLAVRLALAVGVRATYKLAILLELNSMFFDDAAAGDDVTSLDLGLRYGSGAALFGFRIYVPLNASLRDFDMVGAGLDAGVRF
jgi:hypothetical protein